MKNLITLFLALMSYLTMHAKVTIGDYVFPSINSFTIEQSVKETSDKASIILARNYKQLANKKLLDCIAPGMPVTIECGYNKNLQLEFTGYVKPGGISADFPITVECDELHLLRQNNFVKSWKSVSLKDVLNLIAPGYSIECADVDLGRFQIDNKSSFQVLDMLKKDYGFYSSINGSILHCGFSYDYKPSFTQRHELTFGQTIRDYNNLKFETERGLNTRIEIRMKEKNGTTTKIVYDGAMATKSRKEDANNKVIVIPPVSKATAEQKAEALYKQFAYDGYTGSFTSFGIPQTRAGDSVKLIDKVRKEREGIYLLEKVKIDYDEAFIKRENFISYKVAD